MEITQERIDAFAEATGDHQWIHCDPERATRESPFGTTIAHGYLTVALCPVLFQEMLRVEKLGFMINPGIDKVRLRAPVRVGSRVRMQATITRVRSLPGGAAHVTLDVIFEVEGEERAAATGLAQVVYYPES